MSVPINTIKMDGYLHAIHRNETEGYIGLGVHDGNDHKTCTVDLGIARILLGPLTDKSQYHIDGQSQETLATFGRQLSKLGVVELQGQVGRRGPNFDQTQLEEVCHYTVDEFGGFMPMDEEDEGPVSRPVTRNSISSNFIKKTKRTPQTAIIYVDITQTSP